ncbi:MAG: MFS transporter, partial [Acidimicrobiales bacterium]
SAIFVFALPAGALADRVDRRKLAVSMDVTRLALIAMFAGSLLLGYHRLWTIYVTAFVMSACQIAFVAATDASLPALVAPDDFEVANSWLMGADITTEEMAGQGIGGALVAVGTALPFVADAVSFGLSAVLLRRALPDNRPAPSTTSMWRDMREGLVWFWRHRLLRRLVVLIASFAFCQTMMTAVLVIYGTRSLHLSRAGYGLLLAVAAVGTLLGAFAAAPVVRRVGTARSVVFAGLATGASYVLLASTVRIWLAVVALTLETLAVTVGNVATLSLRQREVPNHLLGRVSSAFRMCIYGAMPLGALAGGLASGAFGVRPTFALAGILQLLVLAAFGLRLSSMTTRRQADRLSETVAAA